MELKWDIQHRIKAYYKTGVWGEHMELNISFKPALVSHELTPTAEIHIHKFITGLTLNPHEIRNWFHINQLLN